MQHARLEHLVADREHVVAVRDRQRLGVRHQRGQLLGRARDRVLGADRDQRRRPDRRRLLAGQHLARAADAGGERAAVGFGLLGEGAEHAALRIGDVGERRRLQRLGDAFRQAHAVDQVHAEPAQHHRAHPVRVLEREERRDPRAHRIAHHVGARRCRDDRAARARRRPSSWCDSRPDRRAWSIGRGRGCRARSRGGRRP